MTWDEWKEIVLRLNASYHSQQIRTETAREWFGDLQNYTAREVWLASQRHRRESRYLPTLADLLAAIRALHDGQRARGPKVVCLTCREDGAPGYLRVVLEPEHPDNPYEWELEIWPPCPSCSPGRRKAWETGRLDKPHDKQGMPA